MAFETNLYIVSGIFVDDKKKVLENPQFEMLVNTTYSLILTHSYLTFICFRLEVIRKSCRKDPAFTLLFFVQVCSINTTQNFQHFSHPPFINIDARECSYICIFIYMHSFGTNGKKILAYINLLAIVHLFQY